MENWVDSIRRFNVACGREKVTSLCQSSRFGKSEAGKVDSEKRLRPERTRRRSPSSSTLICAPSGRPRQISRNFRAGTVVSPFSCGWSSGTAAIISISRSVPVRCSTPSETFSSKLPRIGRVGRPPNGLLTCCKGFNNCSRSMINFIAL